MAGSRSTRRVYKRHLTRGPDHAVAAPIPPTLRTAIDLLIMSGAPPILCVPLGQARSGPPVDTTRLLQRMHLRNGTHAAGKTALRRTSPGELASSRSSALASGAAVGSTEGNDASAPYFLGHSLQREQTSTEPNNLRADRCAVSRPSNALEQRARSSTLPSGGPSRKKALAPFLCAPFTDHKTCARIALFKKLTEDGCWYQRSPKCLT